jgi:transcriptional regulator with XRE-family HTH domain
MGSASRSKPEKLANKLLLVRNKLKLSQTEIAEELSCEKNQLRRSDISRYEIGAREPSLIILLRYARLVKVSMESLVDDEIDFE